MFVRVLAAFLLFSMASGAAAQLAPIYLTPGAQAASEEYSKKKKIALAAQRNLEKMLVDAKDPSAAANDPVVVAAKASVDAAASEVKAAASTVLAEPDSQPAPAEKIKELEKAVSAIKLQAAKDVAFSNRLYLWLTIGAIGLALGSSIAGFLKQSIAAGVLSLCAAAVGGTPKALDVGGNMDFYQQLYDGANSLASDLKFDVLITLRHYNGYVKRLQTLEAHSAPGAAKSRDAATALVNELLAAKSPN